jgi:hypothetical protein
MGQSRFEGILETLCWCPIRPKRGGRDLTDEQWAVVEPISEGSCARVKRRLQPAPNESWEGLKQTIFKRSTTLGKHLKVTVSVTSAASRAVKGASLFAAFS